MTTNALIISHNEARRALVIAKRTHASTPVDFIVAGAKAAMVAELKKRMQTGIVEFYFIKSSTGELRRALGTTMGRVASLHTNGNGTSRDSVNTVAFWDIEAADWRSCRFEALVKVC